jgi:hypothetical protein
MGAAAASHYIVNVSRMETSSNSISTFSLTYILICLVTEAGPSAFANIQENYYYVFVGCCAVYLLIIYFYYP